VTWAPLKNTVTFVIEDVTLRVSILPQKAVCANKIAQRKISFFIIINGYIVCLKYKIADSAAIHPSKITKEWQNYCVGRKNNSGHRCTPIPNPPDTPDTAYTGQVRVRDRFPLRGERERCSGF
jgi:hypothetical protein